MTPEERAAALPIWTGPVTPEPLAGGITNLNFTVTDAGRRYLVRIGGDIPEHLILRRFEREAARAAHAAGLAPAVRHAEEGALVLDFIEGRTLTADDIRAPENLDRLATLVRRCHHDIPRHYRGPAPIFWVFQVLRDYAHTLREAGTPYDLAPLTDAARRLEAATGPVEIVFGHNDLLPANLIDDGRRLWLVDWEYAGMGHPLFDLAGLCANCALPEPLEAELLAAYRGAVDPRDLGELRVLKAASLLREALWSAIQTVASNIDFDYARYAEANFRAYREARARLGL